MERGPFEVAGLGPAGRSPASKAPRRLAEVSAFPNCFDYSRGPSVAGLGLIPDIGRLEWVRLTLCGDGCREPCPTLALRHPGLAHAFVDALALSQVPRMVCRALPAPAGERERRIEGEARLGRRPRLVHPAEFREGGSEIEMRRWEIAVDLDGATQPRDRFLVGAKQILAAPSWTRSYTHLCRED